MKVVWTREDEFTWAYLRPAGLIEIKAGSAEGWHADAWEQHNYNSGPSAIETPYDVANHLAEYHPAQTPLRQGSYRGAGGDGEQLCARVAHGQVAHAGGDGSA